jgi:hypothetical protein
MRNPTDRILYNNAETAYRDVEGYDWDQGIDATHLSWFQAGYVAGYADATREIADAVMHVEGKDGAAVVAIAFVLTAMLDRLNVLSPVHVHVWAPANAETETPYEHCRRCRARKD